jgi:uncharacterized protein (TIGR03435 family)
MKCLLWILLSAVVVHAQQAAFEVATVRVSPPPTGDLININLGRFADGKVTLTNASLGDCIKFAYGIVSDGQLIAPDWIKSKDPHYDVVAQAPAGATREQALLMLQALLAERFKLALHHEQREVQHLELVIGKNGPKIKPSAADAKPSATNNGGRINNPLMSMPTLALLLSRFERQTILDATGLKGNYEVKLEWTLDAVRNTPPRPDGAPIMFNGESAGARPSLASALQEQLGLRLESRKSPIDVLVVDRAEKTPSEN